MAGCGESLGEGGEGVVEGFVLCGHVWGLSSLSRAVLILVKRHEPHTPHIPFP